MSPISHSTAKADAIREDEFPPGASEWPESLSRRRFLEVSAALSAMLSLGGCLKPPREAILPYVRQPENSLPGLSRYFATTYAFQGFARGVLAESHQGRPTKLEGNPLHPESLGATDARMQAAVLDLYNPDRLRSPRQSGNITTWQTFASELWPRLQRHKRDRGRGMALVLPATTSPTLERLLGRVRKRFPDALVVSETPSDLPDLEPFDYDFTAADIVLGVAPDFLTQHPSSLRYARAFAQRRRGWDKDTRMNRFFALQSAPSLEGSMADLAMTQSPQQRVRLLEGIAAVMEGQGISGLGEREASFAQQAAADLRAAGPAGLVVAGRFASAEEQALAVDINRSLGNLGTTRKNAGPCLLRERLGLSRLPALAERLDRENVETLLVFEADLSGGGEAEAWRQRVASCGLSAYLGVSADTFGETYDWLLPQSHFLESWGDLRAFTGEPSLIQPLIEPLFESKTSAALLSLLADDAFEASDYERVRETWRGLLQDSGVRWETALRRGFIEGVSEGEAEDTPPRRPRVHPTHNREFELLLRPHPYVDEAGANNPWLLELPEPITKVCWGNALWMNADDAAAAGLTDGAHAKVRFAGDKSVDLPVLAVTGMPPGTLLAHTGLGRRGVGQVGSGVGTALTPSNGQWNFAVTLEPAEGRTELARTQYHFGMEGHNFVQVRSGPTPPRHAKAHGTAPPSLYGDAPSELADGPYAWAMSIDLSSCIGCQACMVACQAENNIPAVGPEQVRLGREMYWIRVDAYQASQDSESAARLSQPVTCMHCEKAPCEPVCPVAATVHTSTGLNAMVYNRCIGTRYCSNNCPYKVRRFNFLDYRTASDELPQLQHNPNVTVRERGVMEKCTYCIQRISRARTDARRETRPLRANEVQTACQQVCPTDAIVFGDLNHPESDVGHRHALSETYSLLEELDVRPRTRYLPRWTNPAEPAAHDA